MSKVVLDMDGVVVRTKRVSHLPFGWLWIGVLFGHWVFLFFPAKIPRSFFQQHSVYVVSHRPRFCWWVTRLWFLVRRYPVKGVYCIGLKGDKEVLINRIDPETIIDDRFGEIFGGRKAIDLDV